MRDVMPFDKDCGLDVKLKLLRVAYKMGSRARLIAVSAIRPRSEMFLKYIKIFLYVLGRTCEKESTIKVTWLGL